MAQPGFELGSLAPDLCCQPLLYCLMATQPSVGLSPFSITSSWFIHVVYFTHFFLYNISFCEYTIIYPFFHQCAFGLFQACSLLLFLT